MQYLILASLIVSAAAGNAKSPEYYEKSFFEHLSLFKLEFKSGSTEFLKRLEIFANNLDMIENHNSDPKQTYKMGLNQFGHLTFDEFIDAVNIGGTRTPNLRRRASGPLHAAPVNGKIPDSVDWTSKGAVTDVKNQGSCGSCWSFSTTGALEGAYYVKYGKLMSFSEQQLVSCDVGGADAGCNGGWMDDAFTFVQKNGGLTTEDAYPYVSGTSQSSGTCVTTGYTNVANSAPTSYTDVTPNSVDSLKSAVAQQPVSIAIQANQVAFQFYSSGILTGRCTNNLDHGVLLVGYGTENNTNYWKVKNSWGPTWGEGGFIRIEASDKDLCGVLDAPSYPNL